MNNTFMEIVQLHERVWGTEQYPGRPSLADLIGHPIVVMWVINDKQPDLRRASDIKHADRFRLSVHQNSADLNDVATSLLVSGSRPSPMAGWKISRAFLQQKPVKFKAKLFVAEEPPEK
jgi:hypothetical protein